VERRLPLVRAGRVVLRPALREGAVDQRGAVELDQVARDRQGGGGVEQHGGVEDVLTHRAARVHVGHVGEQLGDLLRVVLVVGWGWGKVGAVQSVSASKRKYERNRRRNRRPTRAAATLQQAGCTRPTRPSPPPHLQVAALDRVPRRPRGVQQARLLHQVGGGRDDARSTLRRRRIGPVRAASRVPAVCRGAVVAAAHAGAGGWLFGGAVLLLLLLLLLSLVLVVRWWPLGLLPKMQRAAARRACPVSGGYQRLLHSSGNLKPCAVRILSDIMWLLLSPNKLSEPASPS